MKYQQLKIPSLIFNMLLLLPLLFSCHARLIQNSGIERVVNAYAENGTLDLTQKNIHFSRINRLILSGDWLFIPDKHLSQSDIVDISSDKKELLPVPKEWNDSLKISNGHGNGIGTYQLKLIMDDHDLKHHLALYFSQINMPMKIFLNNELVNEYGSISPHSLSSKLLLKNHLLLLNNLKKENFITIQVTNNYYREQGGLTIAPEIVKEDWLISHLQIKTILSLFFIVTFFIIGINYIILFIIRKKELYHLFFALFSFSFTVYLVFSYQGGVLSLFPRVDLYLAIRAMRVMQICSYGFILIFVQSLYKRFFSEWFFYTIASLSFVLSVATIVIPLNWVDQFFYILNIIFSTSLLMTMIIMMIHLKSRRKGFVISLLIMLPLLAGSIYSIFNQLEMAPFLEYLDPIIVFVFTLAHMIIIQSRINDLYIGKERLKKVNQGQQSRSMIDRLTKLPNRKYFKNIIQYYWNYCINEDKFLCIGYIDIDFFTSFNKQYGNATGDACIKRIAQSINNTLRCQEDFLARFEGQRFIFLLPDTNLQDSKAVTERIRANIEKEAIKHKGMGENAHITVSIGGISFRPSDSHSRTKVLKKALQALYKAKNEGRNECCIFMLKSKTEHSKVNIS